MDIWCENSSVFFLTGQMHKLLKVFICLLLDLHPSDATSMITIPPFVFPPTLILPYRPSLPSIHGAFSSIQAIPMTQSWRTLCKTLTITEGSTNTITTTTTRTSRTSSSTTATRLTVQAGRTRRETTSTPICSRQPRLERCPIRAPTPVCLRAGAWNSTYRPPSGPRVRGVDLTRTTITR